MESVLPSYIGRVLDDRYLIRSHVGSGGMSHVFLAEDLVLHREVAIKMLREDYAKDDAAVRRFTHEAKAVSMLSHPNVVSVYDVAMTSEEKYIVLEYAQGITLKAYLQAHGPISAEEAIHIAVQILSGLEHAHSKGIIHRDIKPQNIIIASDGSIKVTDFGIAKIPNSETITMADRAIGSVHYISPEQASGKPVDYRSDLYSLGIILYEMICNRLPFEADTAVAVACMQISSDPIPPSAFVKDVPKGLEQILMKAISKRPNDRFENAAQMLSCLKRLESTPDAIFDFVTVDTALEEEEILPEPDGGSEKTEVPVKPKESGNKQSPQFKVVKPERKKKRKKIVEKEVIEKKEHFSMFSVILGVLCAVLSVAIVCAIYLLQTYFIAGGSNSQLLIVEDFISQTYSSEMKQALEEKGYSVVVEWVSSSDYLANTIISQNPEKNARRTIVKDKQTCELTLVVCKGENLLTLPDYTGVEYRSAQIEMKKNKMNYVIEKVHNSSIQEGMIVSTYPKAGAVVTADTKIIVYVSKGGDSAYITMPNLKGLGAAELSSKLKSINIRLGHVSYEYSDSVEAGKVISQSLISGVTVQSGVTAVDVVVSLGSKLPTSLPDVSSGSSEPSVPILPAEPGNEANEPSNDSVHDTDEIIVDE